MPCVKSEPNGSWRSAGYRCDNDIHCSAFWSSNDGVILTGMGNDGTNGSALIHSSGGQVIAEDESTCVVWGMPRSVAEAGVADVIVPIDEVAPTIEKLVRSHRSN